MRTKQEVAILMERVFEQLRQTREAGQKEYAHTEENALRNFEQTGEDLGIPREKVLWIFLKKHLDGVLAYIKGHRSQREDVRGRIKDIIVYLVLLWAMIDDEEEKHGKERQAIGKQGEGAEGNRQGVSEVQGPERAQVSEVGSLPAPGSITGQVHRG